MDILTNFTLFLRSDCVTIDSGDGDCTFKVHKAVLSTSGSPSLQKLVEPGWREASEGRIDWRHISSQTVERVLTWLYLRDYPSPDPVPWETGEEAEDEHLTSEIQEDGQTVTRSDEGGDEAPADFAPPEFPVDLAPEIEQGMVAVTPELAPVDVVRYEPTLEPDPFEANDSELQNAIFESCTIRPLTPLGRCAGVSPVTTTYKTAAGVFEDREFPHEAFSYREPLLAHVEVYSFAKYHLLTGLQQLALQRTTITLRKLDCSVQFADQEITKIIEYVYDNVPANKSNEEPMRKLMSQFAAENYTSLLRGSFERLVTGGGDFALDLARKLSRRLLAHGASAERREDELECRINNLELQVQERDQEIKTLKASLNGATNWGLGLNKRGRRH